MGDKPKTIEELLAEQEEWQKQFQQDVAQTFYSIRTSSALSQTAFSNALNLSQSYISEIESGRSSKVPSRETLTRLLNFTEGDSDGTAL